MYNQFDISRYYDLSLNAFFAPEDEEDAVNELKNKESDIVYEINRILDVFSWTFKENECKKIRIILEPKKEKILYYSSISQVIKAFDAYNDNHNNSDAKKCLDELKRIKKEKKNTPSGTFKEFYEKFKREHIEDSDAKDVIEITDLWINPHYVAGEFYEKSSKKDGIKAPAIVLYLKTICKSTEYNDYLIEVFAHELFHAYHWLSFDKKCHSTWNYSDFQISTVKEGLASYFEWEFTQHFNTRLANNLETNLAKYSMKNYPYSSFNLIKDTNLFKELFEVSLYDFGATYNKLLELYLVQSNEFDNYLSKYDKEKKALKNCVRTTAFPLEQKEKLLNLINEKGEICYPDDIYKTSDTSYNSNNKPSKTMGFITKELESNINNTKNVKSFRDLLEEYVTRNYEEQKRGAAQFDTGIYVPLNIPKKTFYNNLDNPQKDFAIACALMLKLDINDAIKLIGRAGYKLLKTKTSENERDYIIYWAIYDGNADIVDINEILGEKHQKPLYPGNALWPNKPVELEW